MSICFKSFSTCWRISKVHQVYFNRLKFQGTTFALFPSYIFMYLRLYFGMILQQQLQSLLETLSATEPHYIRCIKPNNVLKPAIFENSNVLQQLRCGVRLVQLLFILDSLNMQTKLSVLFFNQCCSFCSSLTSLDAYKMYVS